MKEWTPEVAKDALTSLLMEECTDEELSDKRCAEVAKKIVAFLEGEPDSE